MGTLIETELTTWNDIFNVNRYFWVPFIFRGQSDANWPLETSIERCIRLYASDNLLHYYNTEEQWMLHEFKRKYPLFSSILPKQQDNFEWLAIMQHHGAPTRLLDFTESIVVAAYFATNESIGDSAIWAINRHHIRTSLVRCEHVSYTEGETLKDDINDMHIDLANRFIGSKTGLKQREIPNLVIPLEPKICTERLSRQQGLFLMPSSCDASFMENLASVFSDDSISFESMPFADFSAMAAKQEVFTSTKIVKIIIPQGLHQDILYALKQMNITAETLFPGIDGLARSLVQSHILG
ncbi:FRG domain-containing protein [Niabella aquatica]